METQKEKELSDLIEEIGGAWSAVEACLRIARSQELHLIAQALTRARVEIELAEKYAEQRSGNIDARQ